jgi:hypothetical protein
MRQSQWFKWPIYLFILFFKNIQYIVAELEEAQIVLWTWEKRSGHGEYLGG